MPKSYIINYDLRKQRDYDSLYKAIKSYGTWARPLESTWVIVTEQTAIEVRDYLSKYMDSDDGLLVVRSSGEAAWRSVDCKNEWLKEHL
ncbi:hypothetical protein LXM25_04335 [Dyadobacter sp. LJ53]|uniref:hypothetical protein n=1 Tax=Dyadobacter chenwenxiniae TaxID=2906456 RepID=UPI001F3FA5D6|nr:hypothetical protein [Dyadobacter chenwenxiniae]MCF0049273.1 hypothetical protein [Dyadobacter chenwenxiniae]